MERLRVVDFAWVYGVISSITEPMSIVPFRVSQACNRKVIDLLFKRSHRNFHRSARNLMRLKSDG